MGAFLSEPVTEKVSEDNVHQRLNFGVCSMQGWRFTQEDNHSCFPALDEACSLFGVYDGHGGGEVSRYVASLLPDYVLKRDSWKEGDVGKALSEAFLALDAHLGSKKGLKMLKKMAAEDDDALDQEKDKNKSSADDDGESEDGSEENVRNLFKEAKMPLELLMAKYGQALAASRNASESQEDGSPSASNSKKASKSKSDEDDDEKDKDDSEIKKEEGSGDEKEEKAEEVVKKEVKKEPEEDEEAKEDGGGSSGSTPSKGLKIKEEDEEKSGDAETKGEPKENGLPDEDKVTKNGGRTTRRIRPNRIMMTDENDDDEDDSSDEEYDENSSSVVDEEEDGEEDEEESSSGEEDEEVWMPKSDEFALKMLQGPGLDSGCTAVVAVLKDGGTLYVANAGDSRCILSRKGVAIDMSVDHKPEDEEESKRIKDAGGEVTSEGRVNGGLNLSRALGDHAYKQGECGARKQMISALPDVRKIQLREDEDEFMVLACDGIWNSLTSQNVVDFVRERLFKDLPKGDKTKSAKELRKMCEGVKLSEICGHMFDYCLAPNTIGDGTGCDNMTAILVTFNEALWAKKESETKTDDKKEEVKSEDKMDTAEEGKLESKEDADGIILLTPPPSPEYEATSDGEAEESSAEEEEEEILDDEDAEDSGEESAEEEVVVKNKGKGCKRSSKSSESPLNAKKQKLEEHNSEENATS